LNERNRVNTSILSIEKSFGFEPEVVEEIKRSAKDLL